MLAVAVGCGGGRSNGVLLFYKSEEQTPENCSGHLQTGAGTEIHPGGEYDAARTAEFIVTASVRAAQSETQNSMPRTLF
eukprot:COSAG01_NODE_3521_length_5979_cov_3.817347_7_plen_79_part_00